MSGQAIVDYPVNTNSDFELTEFDSICFILFNNQTTLSQVDDIPVQYSISLLADSIDNSLDVEYIVLNQSCLYRTAGSNIYTLTVGGLVNFTGVVTVARIRLTVPIGLVTFAGTLPLGRVRTNVISGLISFTGVSVSARTRTTIPNGLVTLSGANLLYRIRTLDPTGLINFSGISVIAFTGVKIYTLTVGGVLIFLGAVKNLRTRFTIASGSAVFSGNSMLQRVRIQLSSGLLNFSGAVIVLRNRVQTISGLLNLFGTAKEIRTKIQIPTGPVVFTNTAPISFTSAGPAVTNTASKLNLKISRSMGL